MPESAVLTRDDIDERIAHVRDVRATDPGRITTLAHERLRRPVMRGDDRLMIVAADHSARNAIGVRGVADAMASRTDLLRRIAVALQRPGVDGVLGTADILDDLLLMGLLDDKVVFGSMNRGGLLGASFELDDRFTGYDTAGIVASAYDGGKMLCRIDLADPATVVTLEACGRAINELAAAELPALVEPFLSHRVDGRVHNDLSAEGVIRSVHIAQGLGNTSAYTWMKLPVVPDMTRVLDATTMPTLLLGGDPSGAAADVYAAWAEALRPPSARGLIVGRTLLYPEDDDVATAVDTAASLVHDPS